MTVGTPGIGPGLHAPHACVLPVYYVPVVSIMRKKTRAVYTAYRILNTSFYILLRHFFCRDLDTRGAQKHPDTGDFAFLQVWVLTAFGSDI